VRTGFGVDNKVAARDAFAAEKMAAEKEKEKELER